MSPRPWFRDALEMRLTPSGAPAPRTWEERLAQEGYCLDGVRALRTRPSMTRPQPALPCPSEDEEQMALMKWRDRVLAHAPILDLLHHIPNGKKRSKAAAGQLKAMGVKRHMPDLFLPVARDGFHGFYDELKALDGIVSAGQKALHAQLRDQGYFVAVSFGWVAAAHAVCRYLRLADLARQLETRV